MEYGIWREAERRVVEVDVVSIWRSTGTWGLGRQVCSHTNPGFKKQRGYSINSIRSLP